MPKDTAPQLALDALIRSVRHLSDDPKLHREADKAQLALDLSRRGAGRPRSISRTTIRDLHATGKTVPEIVDLTGASQATVYRAIRDHQ